MFHLYLNQNLCLTNHKKTSPSEHVPNQPSTHKLIPYCTLFTRPSILQSLYSVSYTPLLLHALSPGGLQQIRIQKTLQRGNHCIGVLQQRGAIWKQPRSWGARAVANGNKRRNCRQQGEGAEIDERGIPCNSASLHLGQAPIWRADPLV